jgi:uncharacterized protein
MLKIGEYNKLKIVKELDFGLYLDGLDKGEILLPRRYVPKQFEINEEIDVFIYTDSEDRLIATTQNPKAIVGDFALLKMISKNSFGAFYDWGLPKDLFVPKKEQREDMVVGRSCIVYIYLDALTERVVASAKAKKFLNLETPEFQNGEEVDLLILKKTDLGFKAIINSAFSGVLYENEIFVPLKVGQQIKGYIKNIREDGKIDLSLQKFGFALVDDLAEKILERLKDEDGYLNINDKSSPEDISAMFGVSKKAFKKAIGQLYKDRTITIEEDGIKIIEM